VELLNIEAGGLKRADREKRRYDAGYILYTTCVILCAA
jgi:hypothetical protein